MEVCKKSFFKNPQADKVWFKGWVATLESFNKKRYTDITVYTSLGNTQVWGLNLQNEELETLVIFPGARTSALFWDFNNGLENLENRYRIFLVETNGLPNLSDGYTPDIKSLDYGIWASEVMEKLNVPRAMVAGASFGGLICMKLCLVAPQKVKAAFLLNPGCLQPFSLSPKNLFYNLLPILFPSHSNILTFLEKAVLCKPYHAMKKKWENLLVEYEYFALTQYKDNTQKPYYMNDELRGVTNDVFLFVGKKDLLFPYQRSVANAQAKLKNLKEVIVLPNVGHGIELYQNAIAMMGDKMESYTTHEV